MQVHLGTEGFSLRREGGYFIKRVEWGSRCLAQAWFEIEHIIQNLLSLSQEGTRALLYIISLQPLLLLYPPAHSLLRR